MRKRYVQINGELVEVTADYVREPQAPMIFGDLPGYQSQGSGLWVEGRAARREDLKRTACRPWEGLQQEQKEAARQKAYDDVRIDASLTKTASEAFYQLPPSKRALLTGRRS